MTSDTAVEVPAHPAPFSEALMPIFAECLAHYWRTSWRRQPTVRVLDPFAGIGRIHELPKYVDWQLTDLRTAHLHVETVAVELLPKWAAAHPGTVVGDATALPAEWTGTFDMVCTSPCYANRMADHHENADLCKVCRGTGHARVPSNEAMTVSEKRGLRNLYVVHLDGTTEKNLGGAVHAEDIIVDRSKPCSQCRGRRISHRRSYAHYYGRSAFLADAPADRNAGLWQWPDPRYKTLHTEAWAEAYRALRRGGIFALNVKNHVRDKRVQRVAEWHRAATLRIGFDLEWTWTVPCPGFRDGQNREARVDREFVYVFRKTR